VTKRPRSTARRLGPRIALTAALAVLAFPAIGAASTDLGPIGFGSMVVDNARGRVLASGTAGNVVDVLDFSGRLVATIPNIYGAFGMVIQGRDLYVAESTVGAVVEIDLHTLKARRRPLVSGLLRPRWLAITGNTLWATTALASEPRQGGLASVNLKSHAVAQFERGSYNEPDLAASSADPNTLFITSNGISPGAIYRLDVSSGAPVVAASNPRTNQSNIEGLAVSPDGTRVIPASGSLNRGSPYEFEELDAESLKSDGIIYPGQAYPTAVAVSGRGANRLATGLGPNAEPDIVVYPIGKPAPIFTATTVDARGYHYIQESGLALSADGRRLFAAYFSQTFEGDTMLATFALP
jgi:hypothetical protein